MNLIRFLCEEVILSNKFNPGGVKQLEVDIRSGLLPIFGEFSSNPQAHFPVLMVSQTACCNSSQGCKVPSTKNNI